MDADRCTIVADFFICLASSPCFEPHHADRIACRISAGSPQPLSRRNSQPRDEEEEVAGRSAALLLMTRLVGNDGHLIFLHPGPEPVEFRVEVDGHVRHRSLEARAHRIPAHLGRVHQRGFALHPVRAGRPEQERPCPHIKNGGVHEGLHLVLATLHHIGPDDRPVPE
jgi:hypothetical protein